MTKARETEPAEPMSITIRGGDERTRSAVSSVITQSLMDEGFGELVVPYGAGRVQPAGRVGSMLLELHRQAPGLFDTPINIMIYGEEKRS